VGSEHRGPLCRAIEGIRNRGASEARQPPVFDARGRHRGKSNVIEPVPVSSAAGRRGFYFATGQDGYFTPKKVVAFLRDPLRHLRGKAVVEWEGAGTTRGRPCAGSWPGTSGCEWSSRRRTART
jgi:hypothetical protein